MSLYGKTVVGVMIGVFASMSAYTNGAEITLVPVRATGSPIINPINPGSITVQPGRHVFLEIRLSDWNVNLDSTTLKSWQAEIDANGYDSSGFDQLVPVNDQSCSNDNGCDVAFIESGSECTGLSCPAGFQDTTRTDWVFNNLSFLPAVDVSTSNFRYAASIDNGVFAVDDGATKYGGTLVLFIPSNARGTFTVGFTSNAITTNPKNNFMRNENNDDIPVTFTPASISILTAVPCCLPDTACRRMPPTNCLIAGGTIVDDCLTDENANGTADACEVGGCCHGDNTCTVESLATCTGIPSCGCLDDADLDGISDGCTSCNLIDPTENINIPLPDPDGIPNHRYLSIDPNNAGSCTALRVSLTFQGVCSIIAFQCIEDSDCAIGTCSSTGCQGMMGWVGPPVEDLPNNPGILISRIFSEPVYRNWTESLIHIGDTQIVPGATYEIDAVQQSCDDQNNAHFTNPLVVSTVGRMGDITGLAGVPDGTVNNNDLIAITNGMSNFQSALDITRLDVADPPNGVVDSSDLLRIIATFQNVPVEEPGPCPPLMNQSSTPPIAIQTIPDPVITSDLDVTSQVPLNPVVVTARIQDVEGMATYVAVVKVVPQKFADETEDGHGRCAADPTESCRVSNCDKGICKDGLCIIPIHEGDPVIDPLPCEDQNCTKGWCKLGNCTDTDGNDTGFTCFMNNPFCSSGSTCTSSSCDVADGDCPDNRGECLPSPCVGDVTIECPEGVFIDPFDGNYVYPNNQFTVNSNLTCDKLWVGIADVGASGGGTATVGGETKILSQFTLHIADTARPCSKHNIEIRPFDASTIGQLISTNAGNIETFLPPPAVTNVLTVLPDCNKNGIYDMLDINVDTGISADCNENGVPDECEVVEGSTNNIPLTNNRGKFYCQVEFYECLPNCSSDCTIKICDKDCNKNGIPDACDMQGLNPSFYFCDEECIGCSTTCEDDCNGNRVPDSCDVAIFDCNGNNMPDDCDMANCSDESECGNCDGVNVMNSCEENQDNRDCDGNGVCNICELDCEGLNGRCSILNPACELENPILREDCQGNSIPDNCDIDKDEDSLSFFCKDGDQCSDFDCVTLCDQDCNGNDIPDLCDISDDQGGECILVPPSKCKSCDGNENGTPDACECPVGCICSNPDDPDPCNNLFPPDPGDHLNVSVQAEFVIRWVNGTSLSEQTIGDLTGNISVSRSAPHLNSDSNDINNPCVFPPNFPPDFLLDSPSNISLSREVHLEMLSLDVESSDTTKSAHLCSLDCNLANLGEAQGKCIDFPADSFFNLYIDLDTGPITLHNRAPLVLRGEITNFGWPAIDSPTPTWEMVHEQGYPAVPLFDASGQQLAYIINAKIGDSVDFISPVTQCNATPSQLMRTCVGGSQDDQSCLVDGDCSGGTCGSIVGVSNVVTFTVDELTEAISNLESTNHVGFDRDKTEQKNTVYMSSGVNDGHSPDGTNKRIPTLVGAGGFAVNSINSISFGQDGTNVPETSSEDRVTIPVLYFSVDNASPGPDCKSDLNSEGNNNRAADIYIAKMNNDFGDFDGTFAPTCFGGGRENCLLLDQSGLGLAPPLGAQANITSLETSKALNLGPDEFVYLTFFGSSFPSDWPGTIFAYDGAGGFNACNLQNNKIYATASDLGLQVGDVIDALAVSDLFPYGDIAGGDKVLFSLATGSPSRSDYNEDVIFKSTLGNNSHSAIITATEIGLPSTAEIDAIDVGVMAIEDCNANNLDDLCETKANFLPNFCEPDYNRYLSIPIPDMLEFGIISSDIVQAIRITMVTLDSPESPGFSGFQGEVIWVGDPGAVNYFESSAQLNPIKVAFTQCGDDFADWSAYDRIFVTGADIVPSSTYHVQVVNFGCDYHNDETCFSKPPLIIKTSRWGDVEEPFHPEPSQPHISDVVAVVDKWLGIFNILKAAGQIQPNVPNPASTVGISDVLHTVDAWQGTLYPFTGPCSCSPLDCTTCGVCKDVTPPTGIPCETDDDCGIYKCGAPDPDPCGGGAACSNDAVGEGIWYCRDLCKRCSP